MEGKCNICISEPNRPVCYCTECNQAICGECKQYHDNFTATKHHVILTPERDTCSEHGMLIEYIYKTNSDAHLYCEKCVQQRSQEASEHSNLISLTSYLTNERAIISRVKQHTDKLNQTVDENLEKDRILNAKKHALKDLLTDVQHTHDTIQKIQSMLTCQFSRCENELAEAKRARIVFSDLAQNIAQKMNVLSNLEPFQVRVGKASVLMELEKSLERQHDLLQTSHTGNENDYDEGQNLSDGECDLKAALVGLLTLSNSLNTKYTGIQEHSDLEQGISWHGQGFEHELKKQKFESALPVKLTDPKLIEGRMNQRKRLSTERLEHYKELVDEKESDMIKSVEYRKACTINVDTEGDEKLCAITGLVELMDGKLLMADFNNLKLKLFEVDGRVVDTVSFEQAPRDVACLDTNTFAVTLPMEKCVQFVSIDWTARGKQTISLGERLDVASLCCGISISNQRIYTATQIPARILVLNKQGETTDEVSGEGRFKRPTYTIYDEESSRVYVSDAAHKCIYGFDSNTKEEVFKYRVEQPHSIALNEDGDIFVADWYTTSVHLVSKKGLAIAKIRLDGKECPQKLFYNKEKKCLYVTLWESNTVRIFSL